MTIMNMKSTLFSSFHSQYYFEIKAVLDFERGLHFFLRRYICYFQIENLLWQCLKPEN